MPQGFFLFTLFTLLHLAMASISFDYKDALSKCILFYEAQRSGTLPWNQRLKWRGDSALADGSDVKVDLSGGYFDAGDNEKFGFPMAFTITMLSWGAIEYANDISHAGELQNLREAIKWGTEYFLKAYAGPTSLWVQVGDPNTDHNCWQRPEDMSPPREAFLINETSPGTEVAAETAAALAASSIVFKETDWNYSHKLLQAAITLFRFANQFRGSFTGGCPFYCSWSGYNDELLWASAWLYKATQSDYYLQFIIQNKDTSGAVDEFSWENKWAGFQVLISSLYFSQNMAQLQQFRDEAEHFFCTMLSNNPLSKNRTTAAGFVYIRSGANTQYATGSAYLAAIYSDYLKSSNTNLKCGENTIFTSKDLLGFSIGQANYILGQNPANVSYMVGYGKQYPQQPHHRGASIPSIHQNSRKVPCAEGFWTWYSIDAPNPNELTGAIVGGPDEKDHFLDKRYNSAQLEPATYVNAPFVGLLARLHREFGASH